MLPLLPASLPLPFCCAQCCIVCGICPTQSFLVVIQFYCTVLKSRYMMLYEVIVDMENHPLWSKLVSHFVVTWCHLITIRNLRTAWTECRERFMTSRTWAQEIWHIHAALLFVLTRNRQGEAVVYKYHIQTVARTSNWYQSSFRSGEMIHLLMWIRSQMIADFGSNRGKCRAGHFPWVVAGAWTRIDLPVLTRKSLPWTARQTDQPLQHCW